MKYHTCLYFQFFSFFSFFLILNFYFSLSTCDICEYENLPPNCKQSSDYFLIEEKDLSFEYFFLNSQGNFFSKVHEEITVGLIVIQGGGRYAQEMFCYLQNSTNQLPMALSSQVYIVAPHLLDSTDERKKDNEVFWDTNGLKKKDLNDITNTLNGWKGGGLSTIEYPNRISSYYVIDYLITQFENEMNFPNLNTILIAGHSAGGQVVQRYALVGNKTMTTNKRMRFVPANPSTFVYFNQLRPNLPEIVNNNYCDNETIPTYNYTFSVPKTNCFIDYNRWLYGLNEQPQYINV
eukprot:TRINITY_DN6751_c0_g1_i2.p1 TRINITY_DN6751_c0_g1~~TRINITY_DN6751_c0_g1_i2.p1  ORF type:complete len:292 (+),score=59.87 TRINITY_DN6751_c0_g1_i2:15-890(+)